MKQLPRVSKKDLLTQMSELKHSDMVEKALQIVAKAHKGQIRDSGVSYLEEHIYYASSLLLRLFSREPELEKLLVITLLHDTVEDTDIKIGQIRKEFGDEIGDTILLLSKTPEEEDQSLTVEEKYLVTQNYLSRLSENRLAVIVKIVDRISNINCIVEQTVLKKPEKYKRYLQEVNNLYIPLAKKYNFKKIVKIFEGEIDRIEKYFL